MATAPDINKNYYNTQQYKNSQAYQNQSIDDIAKKYGFNFSRDYANQQAETIASGQRNAQNAAQRQNDSANALNMQRILDDYNGAASSLDKGYFQRFLSQGQSQVNRGLNGGLAADQNLRLAMNKQAELADVWRTRNQSSQEESMRFSNTNQTIAEALAQIEKERGMNSEKFYQDGLFRGYDVLGQDRNYGLQLDNNIWGKYQDQFGNYMTQSQFDLEKEKFAWQKQQAAAEAAARAARSRQASSGGGGGTGYKAPSNPYSNAINNQAKTPIEKYVSGINSMEQWRSTLSPTVSNAVKKNSVAPAYSSYLSDWDKMKMLGL